MFEVRGHHDVVMGGMIKKQRAMNRRLLEKLGATEA